MTVSAHTHHTFPGRFSSDKVVLMLKYQQIVEVTTFCRPAALLKRGKMKGGHTLRDEHFQLYKGLTNLNHGSFGTVPKSVMAAQIEFMTKQESCPELWFREWYQIDINRSRVAVANLIKAPGDEVVLVENASYAINALLRSYPFQVCIL